LDKSITHFSSKDLSGFFRRNLLKRTKKNLLEKDSILLNYRKINKKSISFHERVDIFLVIAALLLIFCPVVISSVSKIKDDIKRTELRLSDRFEELFGKDTAETLLQEFRERHPNLEIVSVNAADEKNGEPDILIFDEGDYSGLVTDGALASLKPYTRKESGMEQSVIPLVYFIDLLFYNIELLKAAGFDRPPKTREEFITYANVVSGGNNTILADAVGTAFGLNTSDNLSIPRDIFSWIWAAGGNFWSVTDASRPVFSNKAITGDIAFLGRFNREKILAPRSFDATGAQRLKEFSQGKIAMLIASTRYIPMLREKMGDNAFGITAIPQETASGARGKYGLVLSGYYSAISSGSAYPDEAWNFLLFLEEKSPYLCEKLYAVPGIVSEPVSRNYAKNDPFYSKAMDVYESSEIVRGFSGKRGGDKYESIVREEMRVFFEENRTAEETTAAIQRRWNDLSFQN
jgi:multiple sugar transport system substrate-binding protein